jgi:hypothetical protein
MKALAATPLVAAALLLAVVSGSMLADLVAFVGLIALPGLGLSFGLLRTGRYGVAATVAGSIGFGLALAILAGVVLGLSPVGIRWTPLLLAVVAVLSIAIAMGIGGRGDRRVKLAALAGITSRQLVLVGTAVLLTVGAFGIARTGASTTPPSNVTQLWILPDADSVQVGVANLTDSSQRYRVVLTLDGGGIKEWPSISLKPGEVWRGAPDAVIFKGTLRAFLYLADQPGRSYREVSFSLPSTGG